MVWKWRKQVMDGTVEGTFEFQPQLTSEPTAPEPQERYTFVFDGKANTGDDGSIDGLAIDPSHAHGSAGITFSYHSYELV